MKWILSYMIVMGATCRCIENMTTRPPTSPLEDHSAPEYPASASGLTKRFIFNTHPIPNDRRKEVWEEGKARMPP